MVIHVSRFNIILLLLLVLALFSGCQSAESRRAKQVAVLRVHIETFPDNTRLTDTATLFRTNPVVFNIAKNPFLVEGNVAGARIVEERGGFAMEVKFDHRGTMLLEQYTAANPRRHLVIFSQFGVNLEVYRWLAAPLITRRIPDGALTFTPDASREEADQIVLGLNNLAKETQPRSNE